MGVEPEGSRPREGPKEAHESTSARAQLERSQQRYRELIDSIDGVVWEADPTTLEFTFVSPQAEAMFGYPLSEWRAEHFWETHLHPEDKNWVVPYCREATAKDQNHDAEYRIRAADGSWHWVRDIVTVMRDPSGELKLRGIMVDVTRRHSAEAERDRLLLEERAARQRAEIAEVHAQEQAIRMRWLADASFALAEAGVDVGAIMATVAERLSVLMGDGCVVRQVSADGQTLEISACHHVLPARLEMLRTTLEGTPLLVTEGLSAEVFRTGRPVAFPVVDDTVLARAKPEYRRYMKDVHSILIVPLKVGGRVSGTASLLRDDPRHPYDEEDLALLENLADRAALALEVGRLFREAQDAIALRDDFLLIATHELKTPLTTAQLQTQWLRRAVGADAEDVKRGLEQLERQHKRLRQLTEELVDVARLCRTPLVVVRAPTELGALVRDVVSRQTKAISRACSNVTVDAPEPVVADVDRPRIEQLVSNLLSNAIKFGLGQPIELRLTSHDGRARLEVIDHGVGITKEHQARIFERFERAVSTRHYGGFGVGLFIVRDIVRAHGGTIHVESKPGAGSNFIVDLPLRA
ncbi:Sensory box histidine kinase [Labilithrix luteola]|uniref:histidine kinase n=1 Tax=Labilithrix luteola TaxID=1391654 RepID=A0A0K1Q457_9BACT|nr:ATP-binding protein [Labilithrix luteola]AKV00514.1 Sensory box histidine kinase [Labilithrix luteola]